MKDGLNRRDILKLTVTAGVTLAAGGIAKIAEAATSDLMRRNNVAT